MKIATKVSSLSLTALALVGLFGALAWTNLRRLQASLGVLTRITEVQQRHMEADMMHDALRADVFAALLAGNRKDPALAQSAQMGLAEHAANLQAMIATNRLAEIDPRITLALASVEAPLASYLRQGEVIVDLASRSPEAAGHALPEFLAQFTALETQMETVSERILAAVQEIHEATAQGVSRFTRTILFASGTALVVLVALSIAVARSIPQPFSRIAARLATAAVAARQASHQLARGSHDLAEGAGDQASSLEETGAAMEEMAGTSRGNAEDAAAARALAGETRQRIEAGLGEMRELHEAMQAVKTSSSNSAQIIKTIDEIAFQTNILAINAAVEAARAGAAGAGFATVAGEIRSLAQRCAEAAHETQDRIHSAVAQSQRGAQLCDQMAATLEAVATQAGRLDELAVKTGVAATQQSEGVVQINRAIAQIDQATQTTAANAHATAQTAQQMLLQASEVENCVEALQHLVGYAADEAPAAPTAPSPTSPSMKHTVRRTAPHPRVPRVALAGHKPIRRAVRP